MGGYHHHSCWACRNDTCLMTKTETSSKRISWKFLLITWLVLAVVTTSVPVVDWLRRPPGSVFTGYSYESRGDIFVYLNLIDQARHGSVRFQNFFTPDGYDHALFNALYFLLGRASSVVHVSSLVMWHVARDLLLLPLLIFLRMVIVFLPIPRRIDHWVFLAVLVAGGIGVQNSESSVFLTALYSPMAVWSLAATLGVVAAYLRLREDGFSWNRTWWIIVLCVLEAFVHPYVLFLWVVLPLTLLFLDAFLDPRRIARHVLAAVPLVAGSLLGFVLVAAEVASNPVLTTWAMTAMAKPWPIMQTLQAFAVAGFFAIAGCVVLLGASDGAARPKRLSLVAWFVVAMVITRSPYPYAYRLMVYVITPMVCLATLGWLWFWRKYRGRVPHILLIFIALSTLFDPLHHLYLNTTIHSRDVQYRYLQPNDVAAVRWIRQMTPESSLILAGTSWDSLLAQQAYRHVYATQGWQTTNVLRRINQVNDIYAGKYSDDQLRDFLHQNHINYVIVSDWEKNGAVIQAEQAYLDKKFLAEHHYHFQPEQYHFLQLAYDKNGFQVFQVQLTL